MGSRPSDMAGNRLTSVEASPPLRISMVRQPVDGGRLRGFSGFPDCLVRFRAVWVVPTPEISHVAEAASQEKSGKRRCEICRGQSLWSNLSLLSVLSLAHIAVSVTH
jgi:hypothetical protein